MTHELARGSLNRAGRLGQRLQHSLERVAARRRQRVSARAAAHAHRALGSEQHARPAGHAAVRLEGHRIHVQALRHDLNRRGILVHAHELAAQLSRRRARRPRTREEIQHPIARAGACRNHAAQQAGGLLRGITRLLLTRRRHNRMPPHVRGELTARGLLLGHQAGGHVRFAVHLGGVEVVAAVVLRVHEDVVVLGRPAARGLRAVVVRPNQLVNEVLTPKNHVAHNLHVVHFAPIQVQVQGAVLREQAVRLLNARGQERPVVLEGVVVARQGLQGARVALALEPGAVALLGGLRAQRAARLLLARVEGRVNVDDRERAVG